MTFLALQVTKHLRDTWVKLDTTKRLTLGVWESSYITWFAAKCHLGAPNSKWGIMWSSENLNSMIKRGNNAPRMWKTWQFNCLAKTRIRDTRFMKFFLMTGWWIITGLLKNQIINNNSWRELFLNECLQNNQEFLLIRSNKYWMNVKIKHCQLFVISM